ncbi:MAG: hypothetical protein ACTSSI_13765 [Candidatus Helarchaeota archaeon]
MNEITNGEKVFPRKNGLTGTLKIILAKTDEYHSVAMFNLSDTSDSRAISKIPKKKRPFIKFFILEDGIIEFGSKKSWIEM